MLQQRKNTHALDLPPGISIFKGPIRDYRASPVVTNIGFNTLQAAVHSTLRSKERTF